MHDIAVCSSSMRKQLHGGFMQGKAENQHADFARVSLLREMLFKTQTFTGSMPIMVCLSAHEPVCKGHCCQTTTHTVVGGRRRRSSSS